MKDATSHLFLQIGLFFILIAAIVTMSAIESKSRQEVLQEIKMLKQSIKTEDQCLDDCEAEKFIERQIHEAKLDLLKNEIDGLKLELTLARTTNRNKSYVVVRKRQTDKIGKHNNYVSGGDGPAAASYEKR